MMLTIFVNILIIITLIPSSYSLSLAVKPDLISYSGFKVENQVSLINFPQNEYHLLYYLDNKLVWDKPLGDSIPWTEKIILNEYKVPDSNTITLARRKSYALRNQPVYLPNILVGAIFNKQTNKTINPLISENCMKNYWVQLSRKNGLVLHLPVLSTPSIDLTRFDFTSSNSNIRSDWDQYMKIDESYKYAYNSKYSVRKSLDFIINNLNSISVVKQMFNVNTKLKGDFMLLKFFVISKYSMSLYDKLLLKYDNLMQYD